MYLGGGVFLLYVYEGNNRVKLGPSFCYRFSCLFLKKDFTRIKRSNKKNLKLKVERSILIIKFCVRFFKAYRTKF